MGPLVASTNFLPRRFESGPLPVPPDLMPVPVYIFPPAYVATGAVGYGAYGPGHVSFKPGYDGFRPGYGGVGPGFGQPAYAFAGNSSFGFSNSPVGFDVPSQSFGWVPNVLPLQPACSADATEPTRLTDVAVPEDPETVRLREQFLNASPAQRDRLLDQLREGKSAACTAALATAIPRLSEGLRQRVRETLAERLSAMPAVALRLKLRDANAEVRRAAARACALKQDANQVSALIARLGEETDAPVIDAVGSSLKTLTSRELFLPASADKDVRAQVVREWQQWWSTQEGKRATQ